MCNSCPVLYLAVSLKSIFLINMIELKCFEPRHTHSQSFCKTSNSDIQTLFKLRERKLSRVKWVTLQVLQTYSTVFKSSTSFVMILIGDPFHIIYWPQLKFLIRCPGFSTPQQKVSAARRVRRGKESSSTT